MSLGNDFTHAMHSDVACVVGADAALIFHRVSYWMEHDEQRRDRKHDYTKINASALSEKFDWLSTRKVRDCLKKLTDSGFIERAEDEEGKPLRLGRNKNDASAWYRKTTESLGLPNGEAGLPNGDLQVTKWEPAGDEMVTSIKNNQPSNLPTNKPLPHTRVSKDFIDAVRNRWETVAVEHGYPSAMMMNSGRVKLIEKRLDECGGDESLVLRVIDNMPNNTHWTGKSGDMSHITFEWVFGPPKPDKPDRFIEAVESKTPTPKAQHDRPNTNQSRNEQKTNSLVAAAISASSGMGEYSDAEIYPSWESSPAGRIESS